MKGDICAEQFIKESFHSRLDMDNNNELLVPLEDVLIEEEKKSRGNRKGTLNIL